MEYDGSELKELYKRDEQIQTDIEGKTVGMKKLIDLAIGIEGLKNNTGTHAVFERKDGFSCKLLLPSTAYYKCVK